MLITLVAIPLIFLGVGDYGSNQEQYASVNDQDIGKSIVQQEMSQFKEVLRKTIKVIFHQSILIILLKIHLII